MTADEIIDFFKQYKGFGWWWNDIAEEDQEALKADLTERLGGE